jgi:predicted transcriptional regulator
MILLRKITEKVGLSIMGKVYYTLKEVLSELEITPNTFSVKYQIRHGTVYNMVNNTSKRLPNDTIALVLDSLNDYVQENNIDYEYDISDIVKYVR